ncbi:uncharacterized protein [Miscanthus floridulus]|uniref:uncharacterized protein n=1 Tax=Miscanthus floridulus TaxID=154761 RepID=UPI0034578603
MFCSNFLVNIVATEKAEFRISAQPSPSAPVLHKVNRSRQAHAVVLYKYMPNKSLDDPPVLLKLILPFLGDCAVQGGHFLRKLLLDGRRCISIYSSFFRLFLTVNKYSPV